MNTSATMGYTHVPLDRAKTLQEIVRSNYMLKELSDYDGCPQSCVRLSYRN